MKRFPNGKLNASFDREDIFFVNNKNQQTGFKRESHFSDFVFGLSSKMSDINRIFQFNYLFLQQLYEFIL